jgi:hypothetical protein
VVVLTLSRPLSILEGFVCLSGCWAGFFDAQPKTRIRAAKTIRAIFILSSFTGDKQA